MNLSTTYLGLHLEHPFIPGASPMVDNLDTVKRLEDAGAPALVMHSLFEEQIVREQVGTTYHMDIHAESFAEALSYFPEPKEFPMGPEQYLNQIQKIKSTVQIPVIASLNGVTSSGWLKYARLIQEAGATALELNVYHLPTDFDETGQAVEQRVIDIVQTVRGNVSIPISVKLSPFYSSMAHLSRKLVDVGANGLVLFNRFYQPDIDVETLVVMPTIRLSDSSELLLRLRWLAMLSGRLKTSFAVSGGVHSVQDAIKAIMTGADAVQLVSALLQRGPAFLKVIHNDLAKWMEEHEYSSIQQMKGSMNLERCPNPAAFERANYMRVLQSW